MDEDKKVYSFKDVESSVPNGTEVTITPSKPKWWKVVGRQIAEGVGQALFGGQR